MERSKLYKKTFAFMLVLLFAFSVLAYSKQGNIKSGKRIYDQYCVPCHGQIGKGDGTRGRLEHFDPMPRNHTNGEYMNKRPESELFSVIKNGGFSKNYSHIMPPWKTILKDDEIWDVLTYVRSLADPPYKPQE